MSAPTRAPERAIPDGIEAADFSDAAWTAMLLLTELVACSSWLSTSDLAERCGIGRDTARRMLRTFERRAWVRREVADSKDLWTIGPELPRIGLQFHALLERRAAALRADFTASLQPFGRGG